ncbi:MAG: hypothetical protein OXH92_20725 [Bryobacterales bacterium]|nr:hypothetical protein [Bryobacterales bacterium]
MQVRDRDQQVKDSSRSLVSQRNGSSLFSSAAWSTRLFVGGGRDDALVEFMTSAALLNSDACIRAGAAKSSPRILEQ